MENNANANIISEAKPEGPRVKDGSGSKFLAWGLIWAAVTVPSAQDFPSHCSLMSKPLPSFQHEHAFHLLPNGTFCHFSWPQWLITSWTNSESCHLVVCVLKFSGSFDFVLWDEVFSCSMEVFVWKSIYFHVVFLSRWRALLTPVTLALSTVTADNLLKGCWGAGRVAVGQCSTFWEQTLNACRCVPGTVLNTVHIYSHLMLNTPLLQVRKQTHRKIRYLAWGHTALKRWSQDSDPGSMFFSIVITLLLRLSLPQNGVHCL